MESPITLTDTQIVKLSQLWNVNSSEIQAVIETLGPTLRKTEAKIIFEFILKFSKQHQVPISCLSEFVKGLFSSLRAEENRNFRAHRKL